MNDVLSHNLRKLLVGSAVALTAFGAHAAEKPVTATVAADAKETAKAAPAAAPMKELPDDAAAAEVNGVKIPMKDINDVIDAIKKRQPNLADGSTASNAQLTKFRQDMLNDLVDFELLLQEAKKRNITPDPKKVDSEIWQMKGKFSGPDDFNKWLKATNQTEAELRQNTENNLRVEELGNQLALDITVSDADLQKFYDANKERFVIPDSVLVSHILIAVDPKASDADKKKQEEKAQKVLKQALAPGADFGALAAQNSDDKATANTGGSLGLLVQVDKGSWKPIVDAAFAAKPGKVIPNLVKSDFGYHIVDPIEKKPGRQLALDEVRDEIKPMVLHQMVEARIDSELKKLRAAATIKTYI